MNNLVLESIEIHEENIDITLTLNKGIEYLKYELYQLLNSNCRLFNRFNNIHLINRKEPLVLLNIDHTDDTVISFIIKLDKRNNVIFNILDNGIQTKNELKNIMLLNRIGSDSKETQINSYDNLNFIHIEPYNSSETNKYFLTIVFNKISSTQQVILNSIEIYKKDILQSNKHYPYYTNIHINNYFKTVINEIDNYAIKYYKNISQNGYTPDTTIDLGEVTNFSSDILLGYDTADKLIIFRIKEKPKIELYFNYELNGKRIRENFYNKLPICKMSMIPVHNKIAIIETNYGFPVTYFNNIEYLIVQEDKLEPYNYLYITIKLKQ